MLLAISLQVASATSPFISSQNTLGLSIDPLMYGSLPQNQPFVLNTHVFNITSGLNMTNATTNCYAHLYDSTGATLAHQTLAWDGVSDFDTTFNANNFSKLGQYSLEVWCNSDATTGGNIRLLFNVTPTGSIPSTSEGLIYIASLLALLCIFAITLYGAIKIKWEHKKDGDMRIVEVSKLRYFKPMLWVFAYIELMWMFGILYSIAFNILQYDSISPFFYWAYTIMLDMLMPIAFVTLLFVLIKLAEDRKLRKKLLRGYNR